MINVCIIGAGNISNLRHIPAIRKNKELHISGMISDDQKKLQRTKKQQPDITKDLLVQGRTDTFEDIVACLQKCDWFMNEVDAAIIGVPPKQHYLMVKACLFLNKHVLVEKPMMMDAEQCEDVMKLAEEKHLVLNVMHSFQFASGILELQKRLSDGELGKIESIVEIQLTNRQRGLPIWYNDLPLGLFYDEAAHFFYSAIHFGDPAGGKLVIKNAHAQFNSKEENTPKFLEIQCTAGDIPVQMFMNFNSPVCEWGLLLLCDKKIAIYDFFKDILVVMDNDGRHLAKNVLKVSLQFSFSFWKGFIKSGAKMIRKKLLYGHDLAINTFIDGIKSGHSDIRISSRRGYAVVQAMNEVVTMVEKERSGVRQPFEKG